jgi:hypothetical protein
MVLRIGKGKRRSPRAAEHQPSLNGEQFAQLLDVCDQIPGRVVLNRPERLGPSSAALIEQHNPIVFGIEELAIAGFGATAWTAMQEEHRRAMRIAALLPVDPVMSPTHHHTARIGFQRREEASHMHRRSLHLG